MTDESNVENTETEFDENEFLDELKKSKRGLEGYYLIIPILILSFILSPFILDYIDEYKGLIIKKEGNKAYITTHQGQKTIKLKSGSNLELGDFIAKKPYGFGLVKTEFKVADERFYKKQQIFLDEYEGVVTESVDTFMNNEEFISVIKTLKGELKKVEINDKKLLPLRKKGTKVKKKKYTFYPEILN